MGKVIWKGWSKPGDHIPQPETIILGEQIQPRPAAKPPAEEGQPPMARRIYTGQRPNR